jgi:hypothetical protein
MSYWLTLSLNWLPTYAFFPSGLIATPCGAIPAATDAGDPGRSAPPAPRPYWKTSLVVKLVTYTPPAAVAAPGTAARASTTGTVVKSHRQPTRLRHLAA